jgi:hypothetical protein
MSEWRPLKAKFLEELLRHDGLGNDFYDPKCAHCQKEYLPSDAAARVFRCGDCGQFLQCKECCLSRHALTPLHVIKVSRCSSSFTAYVLIPTQEWNGNFWSDISLATLGLVYQVGHGGFPCPYPDTRVHKMTVIEVPIIHRINVQYCKCSKSDHADNVDQLLRNAWYPASVTDPATCATFKSLEAYRLYNVVGNINVHDFIHALERATDATASTGMAWLPVRDTLNMSGVPELTLHYRIGTNSSSA